MPAHGRHAGGSGSPLPPSRPAPSPASPFAVISTIDGPEPVVLRTFDRTQQAKPFRTSYGRRRGLTNGEFHGQVPVLNAAGHYV